MFFTSMVALFMVNSGFAPFYQHLLELELTIGFPGFNLSKTILHWINDGLMAIFFFLIGLEIKGEFVAGALNSMKKAILPIFAAFGGMVVPITIFVVLNYNMEGIEGWGIPMATDIAFSLGVLGILGNKVPLGLKIFLTTYAIIDDLGAVLVIAVFYGSAIEWQFVLLAMALLAILFVLTWLNIYRKFIFLSIGIVIWILFLKSGIHPTIAGVLIAFTIPLHRKKKFRDVIKRGERAIKELSLLTGKKENIINEHKRAINVLDNFTSEIQSPLHHLQFRLHGIVSLFIIPLFGFANSGIIFIGDGGSVTHLSLNIALSLLVGKVVGISLFTYLPIKLKIAVLPIHVKFKQIIGLGFLGGLGFTMSIFISNLAYQSPDMINSAKIGILLGSVVATIFGFLIIRNSLQIKSKEIS